MLAQDSAAGSLHMEATLEPRTDVELPRPFIVQKGPQLTASITKSEPILGTVPQGSATPAPTIGRKVTIEALLKMTNGSANNGNNLNDTVSEPQYNVAVTNPAATDNKTVIEISNNFGAQPAGTADPARKPAAVRISFGLVTQTVGITL